MCENLKIWDQLKNVPREAQKTIKGGRLSGMTDISPQWRYHKMTETFGPIGFGWRYTVDDKRIAEGENGEKVAFADISLFVKMGDDWSEAIPGNGGSSFVAKEKNGLYTSDEAFKMAITDALSVAMKMLGVGAVIYSGGNDYSKYTTPQNEQKPKPRQHQSKREPEVVQAAIGVLDFCTDLSSLKDCWTKNSAEWKKSLHIDDFAEIEKHKEELKQRLAA